MANPKANPNRVPSSFLLHPSSFPPAYTLVELFLTIAVLMVVLGMMVNLANRVQSESRDRLTRLLLSQLAGRMDDYISSHGGAIPEVTPLIDSSSIDETTLKSVARQNNIEFLMVLNLPQCLPKTTADDLLRSIHPAGRNQMELDDAWGSPIVFMPRQHPAIGMAPADQPFFFSAGPDRLFLTREDNLYSYEEGR